MIYVRPGDSFEAFLIGAPTGLAGTITFRLIDPPAGTVHIAETTSGITEPADGTYTKSGTGPDDKGTYLIVWDTGSTVVSEELVVTATLPSPLSGPTFATVDDVAARLGRTLTAAEEASVEMLLIAATAVIAQAAGKDDAWAEDLDPIPQILWIVCIELVCRALANPNNLSSLRESLGQFEYEGRFRDAGLLLTPAERAVVRRAALGSPLISPKTPPPIEEDTDYFVGS